jgi:hypothetical protein
LCVLYDGRGCPNGNPNPDAYTNGNPNRDTEVIVTGGQTFSGKTVKVSFQNNTAVSQLLTGLSMTWPQLTNGQPAVGQDGQYHDL